MSLLSTTWQAPWRAIKQSAARGRLAHWSRQLAAIAAQEQGLSGLNDTELRKHGLALRYNAKSGQPLERLLPDVFAAVREAGRRTLGMRHYDVQLLGGIAIHHGSIVEMQTGEGKTLTATAPMVLAALSGKGALLATANDYLAKRDAQWMQPIFEALGLSVGFIETPMPPDQRRAAYACDVTYGTAKEFGFDFLKDRLLLRQLAAEGLGVAHGTEASALTETRARPVQREPYFALIDEADSLLIDEARTPLVISAVGDDADKLAAALYRWAAQHAGKFEDVTHYEVNHKQRTISLTATGRRAVRELPGPAEIAQSPMADLYEYIERAIKVEREFFRDRQYVIRDEEVVIVDELTGRLAEGRKWRGGIHQAIEAREKLEVSLQTGQAARITMQDFFLRFPHLGGMTGTIANSDREMRRIYKLRVVRMPTHRPPRRQALPVAVFNTSDERWRAVVEEVCRVHATGRPVLVGTRSIDKSEALSKQLTEAGIEHQVLNARNVEAEAEIVAVAGQAGKVTVATNMAGRGTDIKISDEINERGGLHVICTELHESARIDRQLIGRCGRQGDNGTWQQMLSVEDEILTQGLGPKQAARFRERTYSDGQLRRLAPLFYQAQARIEHEHFRQRRMMMHMERERQKAHRQMGLDPYLDGAS